MNNLGQSVFSKRALVHPGGTMEEIYLYDNGKLRRLTNDAVQDRWPAITDDGTIVWCRVPEGGAGQPACDVVRVLVSLSQTGT